MSLATVTIYVSPANRTFHVGVIARVIMVHGSNKVFTVPPRK